MWKYLMHFIDYFYITAFAGSNNKKMILLKYYLHEIWSEVMDNGTETQTIPPRGGHIVNLDARITLGHFATPQFKTFRSPPFTHDSCLVVCNQKLHFIEELIKTCR